MLKTGNMGHFMECICLITRRYAKGNSVKPLGSADRMKRSPGLTGARAVYYKTKYAYARNRAVQKL